MRKTLIPLLMLLAVLVLIQPLAVTATPLTDPDRECSLKVHFSKDGSAFPDLEARIYRVAAARTDGSFYLIPPYSGFPVSIYHIQSQREWKELAATMVSYIVDQQIPSTCTAISDSNGTAAFAQLQTGLYLVLGTTGENEAGIYTFEDFFIYLPTPQSNGSLSYDMEARPKPVAFVPKTEYTVKKLWKDSGSASQRPDSVTIDIYQDQALYETVVLSASNDWSYQWQTTDTASKWTVVEKNVPEGYTVAISSAGSVFTITNSASPTPGNPPKTGDTFPLWNYVSAMCFSGFLLLSLGIWLQRKSR